MAILLRAIPSISVFVPLAIIAALGLFGAGVMAGQMIQGEGPAACPWVR